MPIYEYVCDDCHARYERIVMSATQKIACPKCASQRRTLQLSVFSAPANSSKSGASSSIASGCACTPKSCGCH